MMDAWCTMISDSEGGRGVSRQRAKRVREREDRGGEKRQSTDTVVDSDCTFQ